MHGLRTGSQSVFHVNRPQRSVVETMRLAAHLTKVMESRPAVEAVSGHGRRGCGSDALCADGFRTRSRSRQDAGGSRTHWMRLCRPPPRRVTSASMRVLDDRPHDTVVPFVVKDQPFPQDSFADRSSLFRHALTGQILFGRQNFDAMQSLFFEGPVAEETCRQCRYAFPSCRSPHPIAEFTDPVQQVKAMKTTGPEQLPLGVHHNEAPFLAVLPGFCSALDPGEGVASRIRRMAPWHPWRKFRTRFHHGFVNCVDIGWFVLPNLNRICHTKAPRNQCPCQELNLVYDLRRVACCPVHFKDSTVPIQGLEPCLAVSKTAVRPPHSLGKLVGGPLSVVRCEETPRPRTTDHGQLTNTARA